MNPNQKYLDLNSIKHRTGRVCGCWGMCAKKL